MTDAGHPDPGEALARWYASLAAAGWAPPLGTEEVPLAAARGRVLAADVAALHDVPNTRCAAMDGFAVRAAEAAAGDPLPAGAYVPVDTGEPVPAGYDAVVPVEVAAVEDGALTIRGRVQEGDHVRPAGEDMSAGAVLLPAGMLLDAYAIGVAAGGGHAALAVHRRPRVAVLATGDEVRPAGAPLAPGETADANGPMLAALAEERGAEVVRHPIAADDDLALEATLRDAAAACDLLLVIAGSSRGRRDRTPAIVARLGEVLVRGVSVRPAHPAGLARIGAVPVVLIPGYPVAAAVAFALFAAPALARLAGRPEAPALVAARLDADIVTRPGVATVVPVALRSEAGELVAHPLGRRASALSRLGLADGLVQVRTDAGRVAAGTRVAVAPHRLPPDQG